MKRIVLMVVMGMLIAVGCGDDDSAKPQAAAADAEVEQMLPPGLIAAVQPEGAVDVAEAKKNLKDGQAIVVRGKVAGTEKPLADKRAIMTILDPAVATCDTMPGDACKTPWDACCEPVEVRTAKSATVQVVGSNGKPLRATLAGAGGIAPLKTVVVNGFAKLDGGTLVINAREIHVVP